MEPRREPQPPQSWLDLPFDHLDADGFSVLPRADQAFVCAHWIWARDHATIRGEGLVSHHNWLKLLQQEALHPGHIPGVTLDGLPVRRD